MADSLKCRAKIRWTSTVPLISPLQRELVVECCLTRGHSAEYHRPTFATQQSEWHTGCGVRRSSSCRNLHCPNRRRHWFLRAVPASHTGHHRGESCHVGGVQLPSPGGEQQHYGQCRGELSVSGIGRPASCRRRQLWRWCCGAERAFGGPTGWHSNLGRWCHQRRGRHDHHHR